MTSCSAKTSGECAALIKRLFTDRLDEFNGNCGEAANLILIFVGKGDILYVDGKALITPTYNTKLLWYYHMVAVVDQLVLDPWSPHDPCSIREYLDKVFPVGDYTLSINGKDATLEEIERQEHR